MNYSVSDVFDYIEQEEVKFIRLAFCDVTGRQKNISIMPEELERAFTHGISFDASAVKGFGSVVNSDLFLYPEASTLNILPWRPSQGKVVKMFCSIKHPDGTPFAMDCRRILVDAMKKAKEEGCKVSFGSEFEFYLFKTDEKGEPTDEPFDRAGYMDVAPDDKGENIRREICLTLQNIGIQPESSHHEEGPGQNEIDFRYSDALSAADNAMHFVTVVKTAAMRNGLYADFSPKPIKGEAGNGMHINMSVRCDDGEDRTEAFMTGVLSHIKEISVFLNPTKASYERLGEKKAPRYITWSPENRSQLIRIPAAKGEYKRIELRSADPTANPYLAYALLIYAGMDGIKNNMKAPQPVNIDLFNAEKAITDNLDTLPMSLEEARELALSSEFVASIIPKGMI